MLLKSDNQANVLLAVTLMVHQGYDKYEAIAYAQIAVNPYTLTSARFVKISWHNYINKLFGIDAHTLPSRDPQHRYKFEVPYAGVYYTDKNGRITRNYLVEAGEMHTNIKMLDDIQRNRKSNLPCKQE